MVVFFFAPVEDGFTPDAFVFTGVDDGFMSELPDDELELDVELDEEDELEPFFEEHESSEELSSLESSSGLSQPSSFASSDRDSLESLSVVSLLVPELVPVLSPLHDSPSSPGDVVVPVLDAPQPSSATVSSRPVSS